MKVKLELNEATMPLAQLDTLINILAHQKATLSLLCDNKSKTVDEADELYRDVMVECDDFYQKIYENLYAKYNSVNLNDILPNT